MCIHTCVCLYMYIFVCIYTSARTYSFCHIGLHVQLLISPWSTCAASESFNIPIINREEAAEWSIRGGWTQSHFEWHLCRTLRKPLSSAGELVFSLSWGSYLPGTCLAPCQDSDGPWQPPGSRSSLFSRDNSISPACSRLTIFKTPLPPPPIKLAISTRQRKAVLGRAENTTWHRTAGKSWRASDRSGLDGAAEDAAARVADDTGANAPHPGAPVHLLTGALWQTFRRSIIPTVARINFKVIIEWLIWHRMA